VALDELLERLADLVDGESVVAVGFAAGDDDRGERGGGGGGVGAVLQLRLLLAAHARQQGQPVRAEAVERRAPRRVEAEDDGVGRAHGRGDGRVGAARARAAVVARSSRAHHPRRGRVDHQQLAALGAKVRREACDGHGGRRVVGEGFGGGRGDERRAPDAWVADDGDDDAAGASAVVEAGAVAVAGGGGERCHRAASAVAALFSFVLLLSFGRGPRFCRCVRARAEAGGSARSP
jgi:hypothetical protein